MISKESIDKVKETAVITEVVGDSIHLKKNGVNYVACCPFHDEKSASFTVNETKGIYKCFGCGKSGDSISFVMEKNKVGYIEALKVLADKYKIELEDEKPKKEYALPEWKNSTDLSDSVVSYFEGRKITQSALKRLKVTEGMEWMPSKTKGSGGQSKTIQFNYFLNEQLVNIKYRTRDKDFKLFKGAKLIMYNLDAIRLEDEVIIVEGEMDCLAMATAGYYNCISVPNGASKGKNNLEYLDNSIDYLEGKHFILALDNDANGKNLSDELARRLGFENCTVVTFKDSKDANECLIKYGTTGIEDAIKAKKEFPIEGVFNAHDIEQDILNFYQNGLPSGDGIGMGEFDMFLKFQPGYLTTITGIPGHGKSEFLDFLLCRLNVSHQWKTALYSPENHPLELHFSKFAEKIIGKRFEGHERMNPIELRQMIEYHANNFYFINPKDNFTLDTILTAVKSLVRKKGVNSFVIDAWNKLDHQYTTNETKYISEQLDKITMFCEKNKVHCFLVAHPTKIQKDKQTGLYEIPNLYSISGSANFYNKTANGITVYRNFETLQTEVHIQKVKFKHWGHVGCVQFGWDSSNGRYYKGSPNYDNWLGYMNETKAIEDNKHFLDEAKIHVDNGEDPPF